MNPVETEKRIPREESFEYFPMKLHMIENVLLMLVSPIEIVFGASWKWMKFLLTKDLDSFNAFPNYSRNIHKITHGTKTSLFLMQNVRDHHLFFMDLKFESSKLIVSWEQVDAEGNRKWIIRSLAKICGKRKPLEQHECMLIVQCCSRRFEYLVYWNNQTSVCLGITKRSLIIVVWNVCPKSWVMIMMVKYRFSRQILGIGGSTTLE